MNPMLQNRPDVSQTPKGKRINALSNISLLLNLVVGLLQIHWASIIIFVIAHTVLRMAYIKLEDEAIQSQTDETPPSQPQSVRQVATVITMLIMANILYWLGFGIRQGINLLM